MADLLSLFGNSGGSGGSTPSSGGSSSPVKSGDAGGDSLAGGYNSTKQTASSNPNFFGGASVFQVGNTGQTSATATSSPSLGGGSVLTWVAVGVGVLALVFTMIMFFRHK